MPDRTIAVLGATGDQGYGLALRWAKAGEHVIIGSRAAQRAQDAAQRIRDTIGADAPVRGMENPDAVAHADVVVVSVPFSAQADTLKTIKPNIKDGQIFCDITVPLANAVGGPATRMLGLPYGSSAEQCAEIVGKTVKVVSAFHNVVADALADLDGEIDCDVIVCGANDAKPVIRDLIGHLPGARYVDGGPLYNSRIVESITALLIGLNIRYKTHRAGIRVTGLPLE
ncbi:MAG: NADPH-dependent F420 reductase [Dehalococcoidia bacterium]|nr:NADPH-dependent F420 reductase [Dehalococcoidia bacterium]